MTKENQNHKNIWEAINSIKENHLAHLEKDMAEVKIDISWLKENQRASRTLAYGILATSLAGLLMGLVKIL